MFEEHQASIVALIQQMPPAWSEVAASMGLVADDSEDAVTFTELMVDNADELGSRLGQMIGQGLSLEEVFKRIAAQLAVMAATAFLPGPLGGLLGGFAGAFAKTGGTFEGTPSGLKKIASFQSGGDFMVRQPEQILRVHQAERVQVTPAGKVGDEAKLLGQIANLIMAQTATIASARTEGGIKVENVLDIRGITTSVEKEQQRRARFG
jgi:hypothetical protein